MEDLGNINKARNNLFFISIVNILVLFFNQEINEINILGLIKITDINSWKALIVLLIANLYLFRRYYQLYSIFDKGYNYSILFGDIINYARKDITEIVNNENNKIENIKVSETGYITSSAHNYKDIYSNEKIITTFYKNKNTETIKVIENDSFYSYISITYKSNFKTKKLKFLFFLKNKKFLDYIFPIWIGNISLILISKELIELKLPIIYDFFIKIGEIPFIIIYKLFI